MKRAELEFQRHESVQAGVGRVASAIIRAAARAIREPSRNQAEDVHRVRLAIKSLRALLRLIRPATGKALFKTEDARLRSASRRLAHMRDRAVAAQILTAMRQSASKKNRYEIDIVLAGFDRVPKGSLSGNLQRGTMTTVAAELKHVGLALKQCRPPGKSWDTFGPGLETTYRQTRSGMLAATASKRDGDYHAWRKRAKYLFYQMQFMQAAWPRRLRKYMRRLKKLGDRLGDDHDLIILKAMLGLAPDEFGGRQTVRSVTRLIDKRAARLRQKINLAGNRLFRKSPRKFISQVKRCWICWQTDG